jgi:hypothetical protein
VKDSAKKSYENTIGKMDLKAAGYDGKLPKCQISPNALRINFESQQIMAISLIESLCEQKVIGDEDHIAVIGGGLSGVTVSACLLRRGLKVTLIEKENEYFHKQRKSSHRFIHPSIGFWPAEPLRYTTNLPLLNWHADSCDRVIEQISEEWEQIIEEHVERFKVKFNKLYIPINEKNINRGDGKLSLDLDLTDKNKTVTDTLHGFNFLIDCTGFGSESTIANIPSTSYWEFRNPASTELVVCGSGDGGLIEAIMHVFDIRMERIVEIAHNMDNMQITEDLKSAEKNDSLEHFFAKNIDTIKRLKGFPKVKHKAKLITHTEKIYTQNTAPIHRMLAFIAQADEHLKIYRRSVIEQIKKPAVKGKHPARVRHSMPKKYRIRNISNKNTEDLPASIDIVVRIGPEKKGDRENKNEGLMDIREFVRLFRRDSYLPDSSSGRDPIFQKAVEAVYRWLDQQRIPKPRSLDIQRCDEHFEIFADPEIDRPFHDLFGIELKWMPGHTSLDDFSYGP